MKQGSGNNRADIVLVPRNRKQLVILELIANSSEENVVDHCNRTVEYQLQLRAEKAYVIHFVSQWPPSDQPPGHGADHQVPIATVYHDETLDHHKIVWSRAPLDAY